MKQEFGVKEKGGQNGVDFYFIYFYFFTPKSHINHHYTHFTPRYDILISLLYCRYSFFFDKYLLLHVEMDHFRSNDMSKIKRGVLAPFEG